MATNKAVLIIGGSGFLGTHLALKLREGYKVVLTYNTRYLKIPGVSSIPLDVANRNWVKRIVYTARPDVIIYAAGHNHAELAEKDPREAEKIHTGGPATVSNVSDILQPKFIYLSNGHVFDGKKGNYREGDIVLPSTALGKAKVGGENFIRGKAFNHIIVRLSPIFGRGNGRRLSFLDELRMRLDRGERTELPTSELHAYAAAPAFAEFIARLVDSGPRNKTIHFGGLTKCTLYEFGKAFARRFGYDPNLIVEKQKTQKGPTNDSDAYDYSLNSSFVATNLKIKPLLLEEGFDLLEKQLVSTL